MTTTQDALLTLARTVKLLAWHVEQIRRTEDELPGVHDQMTRIEESILNEIAADRQRKGVLG